MDSIFLTNGCLCFTSFNEKQGACRDVYTLIWGHAFCNHEHIHEGHQKMSDTGKGLFLQQ